MTVMSVAPLAVGEITGCVPVAEIVGTPPFQLFVTNHEVDDLPLQVSDILLVPHEADKNQLIIRKLQSIRTTGRNITRAFCIKKEKKLNKLSRGWLVLLKTADSFSHFREIAK